MIARLRLIGNGRCKGTFFPLKEGRRLKMFSQEKKMKMNTTKLLLKCKTDIGYKLHIQMCVCTSVLCYFKCVLVACLEVVMKKHVVFL